MVCSERDAALAVCLNRLIEQQVLSSLRLRRKTARSGFSAVYRLFGRDFAAVAGQRGASGYRN
jgi:hypothetical protein